MNEMRQKVRVIDIIKETKNVKTFVFDYVNNEKINFKPGQFVFLYAKINNEEIKRAYSISSSPLDEYLELTLELVDGGKLTNYFHNHVKVDEIFEISNPRGNFNFTDDIKNIVLLAGGCGVSPMRSIVRYCTKRKLDTKITLIYSCKKGNDIIFEKELNDFLKSNPNLRIIVTLTREVRNDWKGCSGRIDFDLIKDNVDMLTESTYFLCGANSMVKEIRKMLIDNGISIKNIRMDLWGN